MSPAQLTLHWSPKSPYARKVLILAHEAGLFGRLRLVRSVAAMTRPNPALMVDNPISRIPTMVLPDGLVLADSFAICDHLDSLHGGRRLIPADGDPRWRALSWHALAGGLTDVLILWRNERDRPEERRSTPHIAAWTLKTQAALDRMERDVAALDPDDYDIGQIALGCALEYLDFRFDALGWRTGRPALAEWCDAFSRRPSSRATEIARDD